ncbi:MAG: MBL fold metallo-hydrolase [Deltaproteobacteria bacterium]|nr:MBL fold metallo-hydrolase [Deltaproteobacteria bacterium]
MKSLHRSDLFAWSAFDEARNVDFNGTFWARDEGNVMFDPMPMGDHDLAHAHELGGVSWIVLTNADHVREAAELAIVFGAQIAAPSGDRERPDLHGVPVSIWLDDDELFEGAQVLRMHGSKTPGELAFQLGDTVICGDLVRGQRAGSLNLLPDPKLSDKAAALASVAKLAALEPTAVVVGDGQSVFRDGAARLREIR